MPISFNTHGQLRGQALFLLVPGMEQDKANLDDLRQTIETKFPNGRILVVSYPSSRWSRVNPLELAQECVEQIDSELSATADGTLPEIILVGHSLGALIARKVCLLAHGICSDWMQKHAQPTPQRWANRIVRIVLLAGMSRGWKLSPKNPHTPRLRWLARGIQYFVARRLRLGTLVIAAHRGSPYVVNLRLDWLALSNGDFPQELPPQLVVQIAGSRDTMVDPDDHLDLLAGRNFGYLTVSGTSHAALVRFDKSKDGQKRKQKFLYALCQEPQRFRSDFAGDIKKPDTQVTQTIILVHGIRDYAQWQQKLRDDLNLAAASKALKIKTYLFNYDYLPLLPFLFGYGRTLHMERLMDRYAEARSECPNAECSFFGHSNGTYLLAAALRRYQAPRFARVGFAGSIVQRNFPWLNDFQMRVKTMRNYVASADSVVAIFPSLFEMIRLIPLLHNMPFNRDFGSGGHSGFTQLNDEFRNINFVGGGHSAALLPEHRESIVSFLLGDATPVPPKVVSEQNTWVVNAHKTCLLIWIAIVFGCFELFEWSVRANALMGWRLPALPSLVLVLYVYLLLRF